MGQEKCNLNIGCHDCLNFLLLLEKKLEESLEVIEKGTDQEKKKSLGVVVMLIKSFNRGG